MKPQTKKALRVHLGLVIGEAICLSAFAIELSRALSGNTLSWAYVFEWPILGIYAVVMWRKLLSQDDVWVRGAPLSDRDESRLDAYNQYLEEMHDSEDDKRTSEQG